MIKFPKSCRIDFPIECVVIKLNFTTIMMREIKKVNLAKCINVNKFSLVQFSRSVVSDSLRPHESQHARPPCPSPTPGVQSDSHPLSQ